MSTIATGVIAGSVFGVISVLLMLPMAFADKQAALIGAFTNRFAIGFLIANTQLAMPAWLSGILIGTLISLPDAIITKAYLPIMILGMLGGGVIGFVVG